MLVREEELGWGRVEFERLHCCPMWTASRQLGLCVSIVHVLSAQ